MSLLRWICSGHVAPRRIVETENALFLKPVRIRQRRWKRGVDSIRLSLLDRALPPRLYHYTSFASVIKIGNSRNLRATSAAALHDDPREITHGIEIVQDQVKQKINSKIVEFPKLVLKFIQSFLILRKDWTFIACFCSEADSRFHQDKGRPYSLGFDTNSSWRPQLRPAGLGADVHYYRVSYARSAQRKAIHRVIDAVARACIKNSLGVMQGPWADSFAKLYARSAAQLLMEIIVSFKEQRFSPEDEWRIVCRPNLALNSTAPSTEDEIFRPLIRGDASKYAELQTPIASPGVIYAHPRSGVPFCSIHRADRFIRYDDEHRRICQMLRLG
jgi:hypothetical protein